MEKKETTTLKRKPKLTDAERNKRFVETAKKVGASEKSEDFDRAFASLDIKNSDALTRKKRD
jgi:hypothetical protein